MPSKNDIKTESIHDNTNTTANSKQLDLLKQHFPNCFDKEGNFISHKMEEIVGSAGLSLSKESYSLNWLGKSYARLLANEVPRTLIKEDKTHNALEQNKHSENLLIKGDNLEVLKHLTNAYSESIKMIYIDPPYNTGGDGFVYNDDRKFTVEELSRLAGIDEDEAGRILEFTSSKSNSHSAWLTFMYPRLYVARELLREDGVIFISIDDNEVSQLKLLCDEVFGEENFVGQFIWQKASGTQNDSSGIAISHEYVLCYSKSIINLSLYNLPPTKEMLKTYNLEDDFLNIRGKYYLRNLNDFSIGDRPGLHYDIKCPDGSILIGTEHRWRCDIHRFDWRIKETRIVFDKNENGWQVLYKQYINETKEKIIKDDNGNILSYGKNADSLLLKIASTGDGKKDIKELFEKSIFSYPKPIKLLEHFLKIISKNNDTILDFFAGSGTTAHAVMALNAEDGGNRKFITVQIDEKTEPKSEAYKAGYESIFDITKARIEKASAKLGDKSGFKIYETTPLFEGYLDDIEELSDDTKLFNGSDLDEKELDTLLTTWKAYDGAKLTEPLEVVMLGDYVAQYGANTLYFMQKGFSTEALKSLMAKLDEEKTFEPSKLVLFGYNFESKYQRELKEALSVYTNKKEIDLEMVVRY